MRFPSGVVDQYLYFVAVDATDLITRETGLSSFTVYRSRNGAAAAAYTTPTINETDSSNMPGVYELLLDEDMTIDSGDDSQDVCLHITHAGMAPVTLKFELYRPKLTAGNTLSVESDGDLTKVNTLDGHTAQTGDAFARLGAPAGASTAADIAAVKTQTAAIETDTQDIQSRLPAALTGAGNIKADALAVSGSATAADNIEVVFDTDFATAYDTTGNAWVVALTSAYEFAKGTVAMTESYAANGVAPTPIEALYGVQQTLQMFGISGTSLTVKKLDNATTAFVVTLNDATSPTGAART